MNAPCNFHAFNLVVSCDCQATFMDMALCYCKYSLLVLFNILVLHACMIIMIFQFNFHGMHNNLISSIYLWSQLFNLVNLLTVQNLCYPLISSAAGLSTKE